MKKPKYLKKSTRGQGLIEFALIMPVLLLMVMGIIDFGRMFYIYSAASNAVREAVRVGSTDPSDCTGINQAARSQLTFIERTAYTVTIRYDDGADLKPFACPPSPGQYLEAGQDRVVVVVQADFAPLTPVISSMFPKLGLNYQAGRTISYAPGAGGPPPGGAPPPPPPPPPVVTLSCSPTSGGAPLTVVCSADAPGYTVTSWNWTPAPGAGQGTTSATYTFNTPGTYTVQVTGSNSGGSGSASASITVNNGPVANFTCNTHVANRGVNVTCTDASSNAPTSGLWNWGDGATTTWSGVGSTVSHAYSTSGARNIVLTVSNASGSSSASWAITVYDPVDVAAVTCSPSSGNAPLAVECTAMVSGDVLSYAWDWGDDTSPTAGNPSNHTYNPLVSGSFTVRLTAYGWGGGSDSAETSVTVNVPPVVAAFTCTPLAGPAPLRVTCTDQSSNNPTAWSWQFGDGGTSSAQNPTHVYSAQGVYTVTLTASKPAGSSTLVKPSYVTAVNLYITDYQVCASKSNGNGSITVRGTVNNSLGLPMASTVMTDTTANVQLTAYSNNRFCKSVGSGRVGDTHASRVSTVINGATVITSTSAAAVYSASTCPVTCP
jgi:PKD repeat protein